MKVVGQVIHSSYESARGVAEFIATVGWMVIGIGGLVALASLASIQSAGPFGMLGVGVGVLIAVVGLLQVAAAQGVRAAVDSADYARQSLILQIAQAEGREEINLQKGIGGASITPMATSISGVPAQNEVEPPAGFRRIEEVEGVAIYGDGSGRYWVRGEVTGSIQQARSFARMATFNR